MYTRYCTQGKTDRPTARKAKELGPTCVCAGPNSAGMVRGPAHGCVAARPAGSAFPMSVQGQKRLCGLPACLSVVATDV